MLVDACLISDYANSEIKEAKETIKIYEEMVNKTSNKNIIKDYSARAQILAEKICVHEKYKKLIFEQAKVDLINSALKNIGGVEFKH